MTLVRLTAAAAVVATALAAMPASACDDRFPWTCQAQQPASAPQTTSQTGPRDANASAATAAPQAQRTTVGRKARTARKSASRPTWKRRSKKARSAQSARISTAEKRVQSTRRQSDAGDAAEKTAEKSATNNGNHTRDADDGPAPISRRSDEPVVNPAAKDRAFAGLRDPITEPPPAPLPAPLASPLAIAMLAPVTAAAATTFTLPSPAVASDEPASTAAPEQDQPAGSSQVASINDSREIVAVAQSPSEQHGGTWIQRMLMVLGVALTAAWTTRFLVA